MQASRTLSAEELHRYISKANRIGNRCRLRFATGLLELWESQLYFKLGYSSIVQYADIEYGHLRSKTFEELRVAKALEGLPLATAAFEEGMICWSVLREITRVANSETETEWIEYSKRGFAHLRAEVQDALKKNRTHPRNDRFGLPALKVKVTVEFDPEEHEVLEKAIAKVRSELSRGLGGEPVDLKTAILFLAQRMLETDPAGDLAGTPEGRKEREESAFAILYHLCRKCRAAHLITPDGPVEVPPTAVERLEGEARRVEIAPEEEIVPVLEPVKEPGKDPLKERDEPAIDRPTPPYMVRKVLLRDGGVCANPRCGRRIHLHAHHIIFRSKGGRTALSNEVTVCVICHALLHRNLLELRGNPIDGLEWIRPRAAALARAAMARAAERGRKSTVVDSRGTHRRESTVVDSRVRVSAAPAPAAEGVPELKPCDRDDAMSALRTLGYKKQEAEERLGRALEDLRKENRSPDLESVLQLALRKRSAG